LAENHELGQGLYGPIPKGMIILVSTFGGALFSRNSNASFRFVLKLTMISIGGRIKRLLYPPLGMLGATTLCYPRTLAQLASIGLSHTGLNSYMEMAREWMDEKQNQLSYRIAKNCQEEEQVIEVAKFLMHEQWRNVSVFIFGDVIKSNGF
jgi:hypothetical protein